jgi:hypothetical protein
MGKLASPRQSGQAAVGHGLAQVLPQDGVPWYRKRHLIILNAYAYSLSLLAAAKYASLLLLHLLKIHPSNIL